MNKLTHVLFTRVDAQLAKKLKNRLALENGRQLARQVTQAELVRQLLWSALNGPYQRCRHGRVHDDCSECRGGN